jgi:hypothetical protein
VCACCLKMGRRGKETTDEGGTLLNGVRQGRGRGGVQSVVTWRKGWGGDPMWLSGCSPTLVVRATGS